jgi:hypothetical protein
MQNTAQAGALLSDFIGKGVNAFVGRKISLNAHRAGFAQNVNRRIVGAVAQDNRLLLGEKMVGKGEADTAASTGYQDRA